MDVANQVPAVVIKYEIFPKVSINRVRKNCGDTKSSMYIEPGIFCR